MIKHYTLMSGIVRETISGVNKSWKTRTSQVPLAT